MCADMEWVLGEGRGVGGSGGGVVLDCIRICGQPCVLCSDALLQFLLSVREQYKAINNTASIESDLDASVRSERRGAGFV